MLEFGTDSWRSPGSLEVKGPFSCTVPSGRDLSDFVFGILLFIFFFFYNNKGPLNYISFEA